MKLFNCHVLFLIVIVFHVPIFFYFCVMKCRTFQVVMEGIGGGAFIERVVVLYFSSGIIFE